MLRENVFDQSILHSCESTLVIEGVDKPMQMMYAFVGDKTSMPNMVCDSCVTTFNIHCVSLQIVLCIVVIFFWSSSLMARCGYGT